MTPTEQAERYRNRRWLLTWSGVDPFPGEPWTERVEPDAEIEALFAFRVIVDEHRRLLRQGRFAEAARLEFDLEVDLAICHLGLMC